ncbi:hypothetical protein SAMN04244576_06489 [Sinorhizobium meliloti]|nr:hypothetical protein SAMN04244576_06489 [Sinorhizobium meliloti]
MQIELFEQALIELDNDDELINRVLEISSKTKTCACFATVYRKNSRKGAGSIAEVASLLVLWSAWVTGFLGLLWLGIYSLLLPALVRGVGDVAQALATRAQRTGPPGIVLSVVIVRAARAAVIAAAVAWLAYIWRIRAAALAGSEPGAIVIPGLLNGIIALSVADLLWQMSKALIAYRMGLGSKDGSNADELAFRSSQRLVHLRFQDPASRCGSPRAAHRGLKAKCL